MDTVLEQFESNWVPVFSQDGVAQEARAAQPQEPFSDAYLSGMPSRQRRSVQEARTEPTLEGIVSGEYWAMLQANTIAAPHSIQALT